MAQFALRIRLAMSDYPLDNERGYRPAALRNRDLICIKMNARYNT